MGSTNEDLRNSPSDTARLVGEYLAGVDSLAGWPAIAMQSHLMLIFKHQRSCVNRVSDEVLSCYKGKQGSKPESDISFFSRIDALTVFFSAVKSFHS